MTPRMKTRDPDIRGSLPAMKRAARRARALAKATGTPLYTLKNGRVVNLNPTAHKKRRQPV